MEPSPILGALELKEIALCGCNTGYSALLTTTGEIWTFGTSVKGVAGHEEKKNWVIGYPRMINDIPLMVTFSCGVGHMMALAKPEKGENTCNKVFIWGSNEYG